ncbi:Eukaryotic translation initiation factor 4E transporter [Nymphon striatum]|nr:Eukaryotic translation initiation factor 4E transporter [Nymphon striatum]
MDTFGEFPMMISSNSAHSHSPEHDLGSSRFSRWRCGLPSQNFSPLPSEQEAQNIDIVSSLFDEPDRNMDPSPPPNLHANQKNILEILQNANINVGPQQLNDLSANNAQLKQQAMEGKARSVEELEAGLRQLVLGRETGSKTETQVLKDYLRSGSQHNQENSHNHQDENFAFNKLISSMNGNGQPFSTHSVGPPIDKSRAMSEKQLLQDMLGDESKMPNISNHVQNQPTEQDILNNMLNQTPQQYIARMMKQQELLRRISPVPPDVLSAMRLPGNFTPGMGNDQGVPQPQNQSGIQQREMLMALLKQQQQQQQQQQPPPIQQTASPILGHQLLIPPLGHISPVNHSPLLQDAYPQQQRAPSPLLFSQQPPPMIPHAPSPVHPQGSTRVGQLSPQQLIARTQAIYHNALIQKKVEEQQGNFRRKQEQRSFSPSTVQQNEIQKSDSVQAKVTMATFTPTSVMRRMLSESKSEVKSNGSNGNELDLQLSQGSASPARNGHPRPLHGQGVMNSQGISTVGKPAASSTQSQTSPPRPIIKANSSSTSTPYSNRPNSSDSSSQSVGRSILGGDSRTIDQNSYKAIEQQCLKMQQMNQPAMYRNRLPSGGGQLPPNMSTNIPPPSLIVPHGPQASIPIHLQQQQQQQQQLFRNFYSPQKSQAIRGQSNVGGGNQTGQNQTGGQHNISFTPAVYNPHKMPTQPIPNAQSIQQILQNQRIGQQNAAMMNDSFSGALKHLPVRPSSAVPNSNPANLSKWFGTEILKRNMPTLPPVPTQKALSLEEVERQHQVAG